MSRGHASEVSVVMAFKSKDIKRLMRQEQTRGTKRARPDPELLQLRRLRRLDMQSLLKIEDEVSFLRDLRRFIDDHGQQVGPELYSQAVQLWRQYHSGRAF